MPNKVLVVDDEVHAGEQAAEVVGLHVDRRDAVEGRKVGRRDRLDDRASHGRPRDGRRRQHGAHRGDQPPLQMSGRTAIVVVNLRERQEECR